MSPAPQTNLPSIKISDQGFVLAKAASSAVKQVSNSQIYFAFESINTFNPDQSNLAADKKAN